MNRPELSVWVPRYGTVRTAVLYVLVVAVVVRGGRDLRRTVAMAANVDAATAGQALAGFLWLLLAAVVVVEYRRQTRPLPKFLVGEVRDKFLEQRVPSRVLFAGYVLMLGAGGYVALFAKGRFFGAIDGALLVVRRVVETGDPGAFSLVALGYGVAFVVGAVAFAHAADRVVVAGFRTVLAKVDRLS